MTQDNDNITDPASNEQGDSQDQASKDQDSKKVPLHTFLEQKNVNKELKEELATLKSEEKVRKDAKLLEDKSYEELIQNKSKEFDDLKSQLDSERKNNKLEKIKNKFSRELNKLNVIDADDALRLVDYNDLLDSENFSGEITSRAADLAKNKTYLFKASSSNRSETENNATNSATPPARQTRDAKKDPVMAGLMQKFK